jgi:hypothetical protein
MVEILQHFVAFSEYMNFSTKSHPGGEGWKHTKIENI